MRVDATSNFIKQCDHLWIFDRLGRIVTNGVVDEVLQKYGKAFKDNIAVIATKCDDNVGPNEISVLAKKRPTLNSEHRQWKTTSTALGDQVKQLEKAVASKRRTKRSQPSQVTSSGNADDLLEQVADLRSARKKLDDDFWGSIVQIRNEDVAAELQRSCRQYLPRDAQLQVFCISNTHYEALKDDSMHQTKFQLTAEGTGIPGLRSYLLGQAAPGVFQDFLDFMNHRFMVFLGGCEL